MSLAAECTAVVWEAAWQQLRQGLAGLDKETGFYSKIELLEVFEQIYYEEQIIVGEGRWEDFLELLKKSRQKVLGTLIKVGNLESSLTLDIF